MQIDKDQTKLSQMQVGFFEAGLTLHMTKCNFWTQYLRSKHFTAISQWCRFNKFCSRSMQPA